jgi:hypothetical protein
VLGGTENGSLSVSAGTDEKQAPAVDRRADHELDFFLSVHQPVGGELCAKFEGIWASVNFGHHAFKYMSYKDICKSEKRIPLCGVRIQEPGMWLLEDVSQSFGFKVLLSAGTSARFYHGGQNDDRHGGPLPDLKSADVIERA